MSKKFRPLLLLTTLALLAAMVISAGATIPAGAKEASYMTGFIDWRAADGDFANWTLTGALLPASGTVQLDPAAAIWETDPYAPGDYYGGNYYNGTSYLVGEALSPELTAEFPLSEAIASWNADTPPSSWIETLIRVRLGDDLTGRWTKWYNLGIWAADTGTIQRHSVRLQGDGDGYVAVDTLVVSVKKEPVEAYQLKVRLFSVDGSAIPTLRNLSLSYSTNPPKKAAPGAGNPAYWNTLLAVPECSQMVYPDGGEVWCSPTSTSMVLSYWMGYTGSCEPQVRAAVAGVYDWIYDGHGNWPFNTAYAATFGNEGYVGRFTSLAKAEEWVAAGVPVITSIAWGKGDLTNAPIPSSSGHLMVIVGFDAEGNPIVNDPAAASDDAVQRTYLRAEFEPLWLKASGGTVYLIYPEGHPVP